MSLTQERLKECLEYNPDTGDFVWLIDRGGIAKKGCVAGSTTYHGYRSISIDDTVYLSHRLAFLFMTGAIPQICDHINRVKDDNRWDNLRPATDCDNSRNSNLRSDNTSGFKGVSYDKLSGKFKSTINIKGKQILLGRFSCKYHAFCEYVLASRRYFGEFSAV